MKFKYRKLRNLHFLLSWAYGLRFLSDTDTHIDTITVPLPRC